MNTWKKVANDTIIATTAEALKKNNIDVIVVATGEEAKQKTLELLPKQAEVMTMTSVTLQDTGLIEAIDESGDYQSVKKTLASMNRETLHAAMQKLGSAPDWAVGSVHAVTQDGHVLIASNTGSQLPAYAYGSQHVIWVVGAQKIVKNVDDGMKRIYDYVLPLEADRARKAYGVAGSNVSKLLIINKEVQPQRLTMIIVKEQLGF